MQIGKVLKLILEWCSIFDNIAPKYAKKVQNTYFTHFTNINMSLTYYIVAKKGVCIKCKEWEYLKTKECSLDHYFSQTLFGIFNCVILLVKSQEYYWAHLSDLINKSWLVANLNQISFSFFLKSVTQCYISYLPTLSLRKIRSAAHFRFWALQYLFLYIF